MSRRLLSPQHLIRLDASWAGHVTDRLCRCGPTSLKDAGDPAAKSIWLHRTPPEERRITYGQGNTGGGQLERQAERLGNGSTDDVGATHRHASTTASAARDQSPARTLSLDSASGQRQFQPSLLTASPGSAKPLADHSPRDRQALTHADFDPPSFVAGTADARPLASRTRTAAKFTNPVGGETP